MAIVVFIRRKGGCKRYVGSEKVSQKLDIDTNPPIHTEKIQFKCDANQVSTLDICESTVESLYSSGFNISVWSCNAFSGRAAKKITIMIA